MLDREYFDSLTYDDLVGITAFTSSIGNRAYQIATIYRKKKTRVVLGGIHASMFSEEATRYADVVLTGEAEGIWPVVIDDFENANLKSHYTGPRLNLEIHDIKPRRDLFNSNYFWQSVSNIVLVGNHF